MAQILLSVLQIVLLGQLTMACLWKVTKPSVKVLKLHGPWSDAKLARNISNCECGQKISRGQIPPWTIYIHTSSSTCSGTIVTSNLAATSHHCVGRLNVYDAWNVTHDVKPFEKVNYIEVRSTRWINSGEKYPILQLIPNPQFLLSWKSKTERLGYASLDLLLIKVDADFTSSKIRSPICILEDSDDPDFVERTAYYNIHDGAVPSANTSDDTHEGVIFTKTMCRKAGTWTDIYLAQPGDREKHDELSGLCFRWYPKPSKYEPDRPPVGGAIFLKSGSGHSFLAGVASTETKYLEYGTFLQYTYFSNVIPMIKYLEYRAHQHHSAWCKAPKFDLEDTRPSVNGRRWVWPWESKSVQETFQGRNETLDCVCGVANNEPIGRVVGGEEATPYEFGWMVLLNIYNFGREPGAKYSTCGGAIINDRMILTAAHCMIHESNFKTGKSIAPKNLGVLVNTHERMDENADIKEVDRVIVHPDYVVAVKKNYLDYDIAETETVPRPNLRPICLPKKGEAIKLIGEQAMVAGWGLTIPDKPESISYTLQKLNVPIKPLESCKRMSTFPVTDRFLCAGTHEKFKDSGKGDSGGPLSIKRGKQWTEVGIVSWGEPTGYDSAVTLYTSIKHPDILPFIDYFAQQTGAEWCVSDYPG